VVGFQKVLQEVDDKAQAALDDSAKYQEAEMIVTELQNKYQAAKKIAHRYKLWADEKEHLQREWHPNVVGFQVLQEVEDKAQAALDDSALTKQLDEEISALTKQLDEEI